MKSSKKLILRTKDRTIRERWHSKVEDPHYNENWDDLTYFSICYHPSDLNKNQDSPGLTLHGQSSAWCGGSSDISLMSTHRMRKKVVLFPFPLSFDYKHVTHLILGPEPPCLLACIPHKHPILINLKWSPCLSLCLSLNFFCTETYRTWASVSSDTRWVSLVKKYGFTSQSGVWLGSSLSLWVQVSIWGVKFQFRYIILLALQIT